MQKKLIIFLFAVIFCSALLYGANFQYLVFEVYDHYAGNGATLTELQILNSSNTVLSYSLPSVYETTTGGAPSYWNSSIWGKTQLNDGDTYYVNNSTGASSTAIFICSSSANAGHWARFAVDLGSIKDVNKIKIWAGSVESRIPYFIDIWGTNSYSYSTNISSRNNTGLTHIEKVNYSYTQTSVSLTTVNVVTDPAVSVTNASFGNVRVGTTASSSISVTNTGASGSTLTGNISAASGDFSPTTGTQNFSLGSGQSTSRTFQYTPSSRGADSTNVTISSNIGQTSASLNGTGVSPVYSSSISPGSAIDFGTVDKDQSLTRSLTIQNTTQDADLGDLTNLTLLSATISGPDQSYFSLENFTPGTILSKNNLASLLLRVNNFDHLVGMRYATLTIVTDENAPIGTAGNVYTYQLQAYLVPEPSSFIVLSIAAIFWGIFRLKSSTKK